MKNLKLKTPSVGLYLTLTSIVLAIAGLIMFFETYNVYKYSINRWALAYTIIAIWLMATSIVNTLIRGNKPIWFGALNVVAVILLTLAATKFFSPCVSPMAIYFTVNMGDVQTQALGVPRSLWAMGLYLVSIIIFVVSSFFSLARKENK